MQAFTIDQLEQQRQAGGRLYLEFLREPSLSVGLYTLAAGATDPQQPHTEDEVYYIVRGRGQITVGEENQPVGPGSVVFVAANVEHRFHTIEEEMQIVVFFAPAEYSQRKNDAT